MKSEDRYKIEFGKQVARYLKKSGLEINDFAPLIKSNTDNVKEIIAGKVGLTLSKMVSISDLFGQVYYNLANPNYPIPSREELIKNIESVIARRKLIGTRNIDKNRLLATELDRLISEGHFASPTTSKLVHLKMDEKLANRKTSEITSLLGRSPRNKQITSIGKYGTQKIYIHKDFATQYKKLTNERLAALIVKQENKDENNKESKHD